MEIQDGTKYGMARMVMDEILKYGYTSFTNAQSEALKAGLCEGKNLIVCAPTSSGKTTIAEIAAVEGALKGKKTVYLVTHRALAEEKYLTFKSKYGQKGKEWFDISIATGDHTEGDWHNGVLIATYEKYLSLLSNSNQYSIKEKIVIADEIQILSDESRGPDIEILCSIIKQNNSFQFIALSATIPNIKEIADWFNCYCVNTPYRDVRLREDIWFNGKSHFKYHGEAEEYEDTSNKYPSETLEAVEFFISRRLSPILVFTMTKSKAVELAEKFSKLRKQDVNSYALSEKLDLFSEPTSLSKKLKFISEKKVAFHSADLSFSERNVVEDALRESSLDAVFSTPTLAAGVNFPVRTVIFDSFSRYWEADPWISKSEYLNMSGRAGRLGFHDEGFSVLLPKNMAEFYKAKEYTAQEQKPLTSVLMNKSIRKNILNLIASQLCNTITDIIKFYEQTFWWFQTLENNPKLLDKLSPKIERSIEWLGENGLIAIKNEKLLPTRLGIAISATGLLPSTGVWLLNVIVNNKAIFSRPEFKLSLLHAICASDEFQNDIGQRYLPYARNNQPERKAWQTIENSSPLIDIDYGKDVDRIINAAYGINLWCDGAREYILRQELPNITYGQFHTLSTDISWVLEGIAKIIRVPELKIDSDIATKIEILSDRVRLGVPSELLDIVKAAKESDVPGFGRHRAMELFEKGLSDPNVLLKSEIENIQQAVEGKRRAEALLDAVANFFPNKLLAWKNRHIRRVKNIDQDYTIIESSYDQTGTEYEECIKNILTFLDWEVKKLDCSKRQGVPDLLLVLNSESILIECKTKNKEQATIDKEDAFAILTKGIDINATHYVTLGKPDFGTFCKEKASASNKITLLPHYALIEAIIQFWEGKQSAESIFKWLMIPGVASLTTLDSLSLIP